MTSQDITDYAHLRYLLADAFNDHAWQHWLDALPAQVESRFNEQRYGDLTQWLNTLALLPEAQAGSIDFNQDAVVIGEPSDVSDSAREELKQCLLDLKPWRKGPFDVMGVHVDAEWRSNLKWSRIADAVDLNQRRVLDVGCGNGYYALRMLGAGARCVLGIDPSPRFIVQYAALRHFMPHHPDFHLLPLGIEDLPDRMPWFDTVFSMGVLYHRRSPMDHLYELKHKLRPGGELILETLVVDGDEHTVLVPEGRYAMMRNVWFLPSTRALVLWLKKVGFQSIDVLDESLTTVDEQRQTEWMQYHSLADFLNPEDHSQTAEGLPAPKRAVIRAVYG